jgi:uncharacterized protein
VFLIDVNVLVYAKRLDAVDHSKFEAWLAQTYRTEGTIGYSDVVLSSIVRILTHPQVFREPTPLEEALRYVGNIREHPASTRVVAGSRHWDLFTGLCRNAGAKGNLITDAYFAALAIEAGAEWITADRDYSRFPGLHWRHPLA